MSAVAYAIFLASRVKRLGSCGEKKRGGREEARKKRKGKREEAWQSRIPNFIDLMSKLGSSP